MLACPSDDISPPFICTSALTHSRHSDFYNMPRSDEAANFFAAVYQAVQEIPRGKVTSYGHIARLIGHRKCASPSGCLSIKSD